MAGGMSSPCRSLRCLIGKLWLFAIWMGLALGALTPVASAKVRVLEEEGKVTLENDKVRVVVRNSPGKAPLRQFFARDGKVWKLVLESFAPDYAKADKDAVALWDMRPNKYRHLVTGLAGDIGVNHFPEGNEEMMTIYIKRLDCPSSELITLMHEEDFFQVSVVACPGGAPVKLDYLLSAYTFAHEGVPQFVHTPGVKFDDPRAGAGKNQVTGDRSFHAPAVILQEGGLFAALVPQLDELNTSRVLSPDARRKTKIGRGPFSIPIEDEHYTMPSMIDLNVKSGITKSPVMTFGIADTVIGHHIRYVRYERGENGEAMVRAVTGTPDSPTVPIISYAFDLFLGANVPEGTGYQRVARHQWEKYGHPVFAEKPHLAMPFEEYVKLVTKTIFSPILLDGKPVKTPAGVMDAPVAGYEDHGSWLEWEMDGKPVGGFRCAAPFWDDVVHNSPFWNNAEQAVGMFFCRDLDDKLAERARRIINFCLSAPRNPSGLFATLYNARAKTWGIAWTDPMHGEARLFLRDSKSYEIPALCKTGAFLLDYHLRAEPDERIVTYLRPFADWLITAIDEKGTVPSFVSVTMEASPILRDSAQSAVAAWFLAEMFNATKDAKYLDAARRIAAFIEKEILPTAKWIDFEQYLSCGAKPFTMVRDEWQGQFFRGNMSVIWAAEAFAALHRADGDKRWLTDGERTVDYLSFTQCVWQPHFIYTANPFGGFGVDNSDSAPMLDQRQSETVRPFIYFGKKLGRQDLIERAVAAARAGCVLIVNPRHKENGIFPHAMFYPDGVSPENIDHEAHPQCPMRTHPCWGEGSAVFTGLAEARRGLGGIYVDAAHKFAVGVDGVKVVKAEFVKNEVKLKVESWLSAAYLKMPWTEVFTFPIVSHGEGSLEINDGHLLVIGSFGSDEDQLHRFTMLTADNDKISPPADILDKAATATWYWPRQTNDSRTR